MMIWRISKGSPGIQTKFDSLRGPVAGSQWVSRLCHPAKLQQPSLFGHLITSNKIALLSNSFNLLPAWPSQPQPCFLMQHQQASKRYFSFSLGSTMSQQTWLLSSIAFVLLKKLVPNCQGRIVRNLGHPRPARKQRRGTHPLKSNASPAPANYIKLWVCRYSDYYTPLSSISSIRKATISKLWPPGCANEEAQSQAAPSPSDHIGPLEKLTAQEASHSHDPGYSSSSRLGFDPRRTKSVWLWKTACRVSIDVMS